MKYVIRVLVGTLVGFVAGALLNLALSYGFCDGLWMDLRSWTVFDFFERFDQLDNLGSFALWLPTIVGACSSAKGIWYGLLGMVIAAAVVTIVTFVIAFFIIVGWSGILVGLLMMGLFAEPAVIIIELIFP